MSTNAVYKGFDHSALEREYSARGTVPVTVFEAAVARYAELSALSRKELDCRLDVSYGPTGEQVLDIFPAGAGAPLLVFIHGGYWRAMSHKESSFMAQSLTAAGAAVAAVNYALAPAVSLDEIVRQCRAALAWCYSNAHKFGVDPERLYLCGNSAGGHLVGMLIADGWHDAFSVPENCVKGACALSGLYDLEPIQMAEPNTWLHLDDAAVHRNSPLRHIPKTTGCPLIVSYGGNETSEFKRQTLDFRQAWRQAGFDCEHVAMEHANHFDIVLDLCDPNGRLTRPLLELMNP